MAIKQGWDFEASHGFTASAGKTIVQGYARGGGVRKPMNLHLKKGALHSSLGVKQGSKIPVSKIKAAESSSSPLLRKRAQFADNARKWQHKAEGGVVQSDDKGKLGPDLNVRFPGNHLAYKAGGKVQDDACGGPVMKAKGGMMRPPGMPRSPVVGMKRTRNPRGMAGGMSKPMPAVPGLPAGGAGPMGVPGKPGSPPRVLAKGGKARC